MVFARITFALFALFMLLLGFGLLIQFPWLIERWLWPDAPWISHVFMSSVFLAFSFGYFFLAFQGKWRPVRNFSIVGLLSFGGLAIYLLGESSGAAEGGYDQFRLLSWGEILLLVAILNAIYWAISQIHPYSKKVRMPSSLRWILGFILAANLWVGIRLIVAVDAVAWKLTDEMAITYGWALFGAAVLAFLACMEPYWENQGTIFAALLGYDLILVGPLFYLLFNPTIVPSVPYRTLVYIIFVLGSLAAVIGYSAFYLIRRKKLSEAMYE